MNDAIMSKVVVMFPKFFVLFASNSYNFCSMLNVSASFLAILASRAVSNAITSLLHMHLSLSCDSTRARYSQLKSRTKSTMLSVPEDFRLRPVEPGVASPGVAGVVELGVVVALVAGLLARTQEGINAAGGLRPNCFFKGATGRSESRTSVGFPKICLFPTKLSIVVYMVSVNSSGILLVLDNSLFSSLLMPHQFADPDPSM